MSKEFRISREVQLAASPEQVWDALTVGTSGWLWPMEYEHREGGAAPFGGTVTAWDPARQLTARVDGEDGWFNQLEHTLEARDGGTYLRYVHSGVFVDDWDNQYDGADQHTDFYLHTLGQYVRYFAPRIAGYATGDGPEASHAPDGFERLRAALIEAAGPGDAVSVELDGIGAIEGVVDYAKPNFVGIRTDDAMYRFFGRNAFGDYPVGFSHHLFGDVDQEKVQLSWQNWIDALYAPSSH